MRFLVVLAISIERPSLMEIVALLSAFAAAILLFAIYRIRAAARREHMAAMNEYYDFTEAAYSDLNRWHQENRRRLP